MTEPLKGACMCGACTFTATPRSMEMGACHCGMCRKWSGGVFLTADCSGQVTFAEDAPLGRYRGSPWAERVFCSQCGSTLMWQSQDGSHQRVSIQSFDDPGAFRFVSQIYIDSKPDNYAFADDTTKMTQAEVEAMFLAQPGDHG